MVFTKLVKWVNRTVNKSNTFICCLLLGLFAFCCSKWNRDQIGNLFENILLVVIVVCGVALCFVKQMANITYFVPRKRNDFARGCGGDSASAASGISKLLRRVPNEKDAQETDLVISNDFVADYVDFSSKESLIMEVIRLREKVEQLEAKLRAKDLANTNRAAVCANPMKKRTKNDLEIWDYESLRKLQINQQCRQMEYNEALLTSDESETEADVNVDVDADIAKANEENIDVGNETKKIEENEGDNESECSCQSNCDSLNLSLRS